MKVMRKMIEIDEEKCDGCGLCISGCHENALGIVNGKAKLLKESYCDGLGACIGDCPRGALTVVEREAEEYVPQPATPSPLPCGCPGTMAKALKPAAVANAETGSVAPELRQWPVQLTLVPTDAPYWKDADLLVAADCVAVAYGDFQRKLLKGHGVVIACPKLDETGKYAAKLAEIIRRNHIRSITVAHMEVPCCTGIVNLAKQAIVMAGTEIPLRDVTVTLDGKLIEKE